MKQFHLRNLVTIMLGCASIMSTACSDDPSSVAPISPAPTTTPTTQQPPQQKPPQQQPPTAQPEQPEQPQANHAPSAAVGGDAFKVKVGDVVTLDGFPSSDPDSGAKLSYKWQVTKRPQGSKAEPIESASMKTQFTPDIVGDYEISLVVTDEHAAASKPVLVKVNAADRSAQQAPNHAPTINVQEHAKTGGAGIGITLVAAADDEDATDKGKLEYKWLLEKPAGADDIPEGSRAALTLSYVPKVPGTYEFVLTAKDTAGALSAASFKFTAEENKAPLAALGANRVAKSKDKITLDGSKSSDPNGDLIAKWAWTVTGPDGKEVSVEGADTKSPAFTPAADGLYLVSLKVSDGIADSEAKTVKVFASADGLVPYAEIADVSQGKVGSEIVFDAGASYGRDGDALEYAWTVVQEGTGVEHHPTADPSDKTKAKYKPISDGKFKVTVTVKVGEKTNSASKTFAVVY